MGMSDGMENLMDDEQRAALEMSRDDLLRMFAEGEPATVRRTNAQQRNAVAHTSSEDGQLADLLNSTNQAGPVRMPMHRVINREPVLT